MVSHILSKIYFPLFERKIFHSLDRSPDAAMARAGLGLHPDRHVGAEAQALPYLPRHTSRELDQKGRSRHSNWCPNTGCSYLACQLNLLHHSASPIYFVQGV